MPARFLEQYILPSNKHAFVSRIYDLSIIGMHSGAYEDLAKYADCKYALDCNYALSMLNRRVQSLNLVGRMLWPTNMPKNFQEFSLTHYEWLTISADVFLARYISVVDCAMILVNEILECGLLIEACTIHNLRKKAISHLILDHLGTMIDDQGLLRKERNSRFHHGAERGFGSDDQTFRIVSMLGLDAHDVRGPNGEAVSIAGFFKEGLVELQGEFNAVMPRIATQLDRLYDMLHPEFERRFSPKFQVGPFARTRRT